jgi:hypothetical protein
MVAMSDPIGDRVLKRQPIGEVPDQVFLNDR